MESVFNQFDLYQVAEIELSYKRKVKPIDRPKLFHSKDAADLLYSIWNKEKIDFIEEFKVILLNKTSRVLGVVDIAAGGINEVYIDHRLIFAAALKGAATDIILTHNHPSGQVTPSSADQLITRRIKEGGQILNISVRDHIIISSEGYLSFADEGFL